MSFVTSFYRKEISSWLVLNSDSRLDPVIATNKLNEDSNLLFIQPR